MGARHEKQEGQHGQLCQASLGLEGVISLNPQRFNRIFRFTSGWTPIDLAVNINPHDHFLPPSSRAGTRDIPILANAFQRRIRLRFQPPTILNGPAFSCLLDTALPHSFTFCTMDSLSFLLHRQSEHIISGYLVSAFLSQCIALYHLAWVCFCTGCGSICNA